MTHFHDLFNHPFLSVAVLSLTGSLCLAMSVIDSAHGQTGIDGCVAGAVCRSSGYGSSAQDQEKERRYREAYQAQLRAAQERQEQERQRELQDQQMRQNAANAQMNSILDQFNKRQRELEAEDEESERNLRSSNSTLIPPMPSSPVKDSNKSSEDLNLWANIKKSSNTEQSTKTKKTVEKNNCAKLIYFRDHQLYTMWSQAIKDLPKAHIYDQAKVDLEKIRQQLIPYNSKTMDVIQYGQVFAQTVKTNCDLIMDLLKLSPLAPEAVAVEEVYDYSKKLTYDLTSEQEIIEFLKEEAKGLITDALEKLAPNVGKSVDAIVNLSENIITLKELTSQNRLSAEVNNHIRRIDKMLASYQKSIESGIYRTQAINKIKSSIDSQCGRKKTNTSVSIKSLP